MLNRQEIMKAAWIKYSADHARFDAGKPFSRWAFAQALSYAWRCAKLAAQMAAQDAARASEPAVLSQARSELLGFQTKDFWTSADMARVSALSSVVTHAV